MKRQCGFTLIETLVYLGLFALVMTGIVAAAYSMLELSGRTQARGTLTAEGNFLLGKINWGLSGASGVNPPASGSSGNTLTFTKAGSSLSFAFSGGNLTLQRGANPVATLNNSNVTVAVTPPATSIFSHTGSGVNPESVTASFTLSITTPNGASLSQDFSTTKYLRK